MAEPPLTTESRTKGDLFRIAQRSTQIFVLPDGHSLFGRVLLEVNLNVGS